MTTDTKINGEADPQEVNWCIYKKLMLITSLHMTKYIATCHIFKGEYKHVRKQT